MANLYADENFKYAVVQHLRSYGHDVLTVQEAGEQGSGDAQVLAHATAAKRASSAEDIRRAATMPFPRYERGLLSTSWNFTLSSYRVE